jgi:hypothetical protein
VDRANIVAWVALAVIRATRVIRLVVMVVMVAALVTLMERMAVVVGVGTTVIIDALEDTFSSRKCQQRLTRMKFSLSFLFRFLP